MFMDKIIHIYKNFSYLQNILQIEDKIKFLRTFVLDFDLLVKLKNLILNLFIYLFIYSKLYSKPILKVGKSISW